MLSQKRISSEKWLVGAIGIVCGLICVPAPSQAAVAVITNRTTSEVSFSVAAADDKDQRAKATDYKLASGDLTVVNLPRGTTAALSLIPGNQKRGSADTQAASYK